MQSLDLDRLNETVLLQRERSAAAAPFPHIVLDGLLYPDVADAVVREFDAARDGWPVLPALQRDRWLLAGYSFMKRYTPLSDAMASKILKHR